MSYLIMSVVIDKHKAVDLEKQVGEHGFIDNIIIEKGENKKAVCTFRILRDGSVMAIDSQMNPMTESEFGEVLDKVEGEEAFVAALRKVTFVPFSKKDLDDLLKRLSGVKGFKVSR